MADPNHLKTRLDLFVPYEKSQLLHRTGWGDLNFAEASKDIDAIFEIVEILDDLPLERLPANAIQSMADSLDRVLVWILKIDKFSIQDGSPGSTRNDIVNNLATVQQDLYVSTHQWIPFLAYLKGDIPAQLRQITSSVELSKNAKGDFDQYLTDRRAELDKIIQATREASAEAGVGEFTKDFATEANNRDVDAGTWLTRSTIAALVTLAVAVAFFFVHPPENQYALIQYSTSKLVILAMLIGVTAWCAGNFKANKHQATVSRHKAHALRTFQAFVQASDNENVKNAVLLETTRSIFSQNQTGYLKGDVPNEGSSRIVEIIKGNTDASA